MFNICEQLQNATVEEKRGPKLLAYHNDLPVNVAAIPDSKDNYREFHNLVIRLRLKVSCACDTLNGEM